MKTKSLNKLVLTVMAALFLLVPVGNLWAVERTGQIVQSILNEIDDKMTALDESKAAIEGERAQIIREREDLATQYRTEENEVKRQELAALLQEKLERESRSDVEEIHLYLNTLQTLIPKLKELKSALSQADHTALEEVTTLNRVRKTVAGFLQGSSRIALALQEADPNDPTVGDMMEKLTLMQDVYNNNLNVEGAEGSLARIDDYVRHLNSLYAKMIMASKTIEQERRGLAVANYIALSKIALLRVNDTVSFAELNKRPEDFIKHSRERNKIIAETMDTNVTQRPMQSKATVKQKQQVQQRIEQMAQGKVFQSN